MGRTERISRRRFLSTTAGTAAAAAMARGGFAAVQDPVADAPRTKSAKGVEKVAWKAEPFPMEQVTLRPGPFLEARERNTRLLKDLPNDRLVHMFRVTAGLPSTAEPLQGWEAPECELRGHFAGGHYLSACALTYASAKDEELRKKADALVTELVKCQQENGYLGAYPEEFYARLKRHEKVWAPFYTYHKILAGMLDMYVHTGNEEALRCAERMAGWAGAWVTALPEDEWAKVQTVEHGGMNEAMFNLHALTGEQRYLEWGQRFEHKAFFDPLAARQDRLAHNHANTNIPKVIGAARGYELTGDDRYHTVADYFWNEVVDHHTYVTGGTSNNEGWVEPGRFADQLGPFAEECCCSYNMMKLSRHVHGWTGDARVMDYYERLLFNVRLGTQDRDGLLMYYVSLKPGMFKTYSQKFGTPGKQDTAFWCCTGTGVEEFAKMNDSIYSHDADGMFVNLFVPSEVHWPEKGVRVVQETSFPEQEGTSLTVDAAKPVRMAMRVRIPYWAAKGVVVKVNGKVQKVDAAPGTYAAIERRWVKGDRVEIALPMHLHAEPLPDDGTVQAMMYGPLVLAGLMGSDGLTEEKVIGPMGPGRDRKDEPGRPMPEVSVREGAVWAEPGKGRLEFRTAGAAEAMPLMPLYRVRENERYTVFFKVKQGAA